MISTFISDVWVQAEERKHYFGLPKWLDRYSGQMACLGFYLHLESLNLASPSKSVSRLISLCLPPAASR